MDSIINEMMEDKSLNFKFLLAVQQCKYEEAYEIGKTILQTNPYDKSKIWAIVRHPLKFYVDGLFDFEYEEEEEYEQYDEEGEEEEEEEEVDEEDEEEEEPIEGEEEEEENSEYEWVYEDDEEGFENEEDQFVQEDNNEGDISLNMDKKIKESIPALQTSNQKLPPKRVIQQVKPKSSIPNGIPTLPKIKQKSRPNSQSKQQQQQQQKQQPIEQNLMKQAPAVNQLRFPSSMAKKK